MRGEPTPIGVARLTILSRTAVVIVVVALATFANPIGGVDVSSDALFTLYGTALGYVFGIGQARVVRGNGGEA